MAGMSWDQFKKAYIKKRVKEAELELVAAEKWFSSPIERVMYLALHNQQREFPDIHFESQKRFGKYTVDFYVRYESDKGVLEVIIECDGHDYHERTKEQAARDRSRDRYFTSRGFKVLRYTGSEIMSKPFDLTGDLWQLITLHDDVA